MIDISDVNIFDIFVIAFIIYHLFKGFSKGFLASILSFVILIALFWGFFPLVSLMSNYIEHQYSYVIAFIIALVLTMIVKKSLNVIVKKSLHKAKLKKADQFIGLMFGLLKGFFYLSLVLAVVKFLYPYYSQGDIEEQYDTLSEAKMYGSVNLGASIISDLIPDSAKQFFYSTISKTDSYVSGSKRSAKEIKNKDIDFDIDTKSLNKLTK